MSLHHGWRRASAVALTFVAVWLCLRYLFPLFLPFLFGLAISLAAEPFAIFLQRRLRWRRGCAAACAVTVFLLVTGAALWLAGAVAVERAMHLAGSLDGAAEQLAAGVETLRVWAVSLASRAPSALAQPQWRSFLPAAAPSSTGAPMPPWDWRDRPPSGSPDPW